MCPTLGRRCSFSVLPPRWRSLANDDGGTQQSPRPWVHYSVASAWGLHVVRRSGTVRIDLALAVMGYNPSSKVSSLADIKAVGTSCACTAGGNAARLLSEAGCDFIGRLNTPTSASWIAPSTTVACPTADTVLATPKAERWATWDDASCSTCRDVWPCGSIDAPCCVKGVTTTQDAPTSCQADALPLSTVPPKGRMHTEQEL